MSQELNSQISSLLLSVGSNHALNLESNLQELPMYTFEVEIGCIVQEFAKFLDQYPLLPGVILLEHGRYIGMISRRRLLEFLIRPYGQEIFFKESLRVIYSYARVEILLLPETTPILTAMQHSLQRSPELLAEPIVVQTADNTYKLLAIEALNFAAWQIQTIANQIRYESSQAKMIQNDKMANLGRLVDGVVHEILDPVSFIWGNLTYVTSYTQDLLKLINAYDQNLTHSSTEINTLKSEIEFDFLEQDLSSTLNSIRSGAERLKKLVTSLQNFCHIDEVHPKPVDLHACLDSTILLINTRIKGEIEIIKNYGNLPPVYCFMSQLNQVFINILSQTVNVLLNTSLSSNQYNSHSLNPQQKSRIEITTQVVSQPATNSHAPDSRWVSIRITDNGPGISPELQKRILESFSSEKMADKETSLGMSYRIITSKHGGKFHFRSQLNIGTDIEILLPLV
ncbi:sensor histidine kinase [Anabaena sp. UHCC 0253]|uniref:sensor histidine kinase n=1 Tax=Anabaena sp. UHCC 0253 TaxID=2590019 RepID=UPI001446D9DA|nr:sensor histidine kinase [Anabaena sp. UHCC 0253]